MNLKKYAKDVSDEISNVIAEAVEESYYDILENNGMSKLNFGDEAVTEAFDEAEIKAKNVYEHALTKYFEKELKKIK